jgi:hypothetical protein
MNPTFGSLFDLSRSIFGWRRTKFGSFYAKLDAFYVKDCWIQSKFLRDSMKFHWE